MKKQTWLNVFAGLILLKILLHLYTNGLWSFHRDELLYLALGRHLDWGYASVPPSIGFFAWLGAHFPGNPETAIRLISTLTGTATVLLTGLMAIEMLPPDRKRYPGVFSVLIAGLAGLLSGAFLRPCMMFQPVVFDIFYWTLLSWLLLNYINSENNRWLLWFGAAAGFGLLNKYSILIQLAALLPGILLSEQRNIFKNKNLYIAVGIGLLVFLPNILWQVLHEFPVFRHISELAATQFVHVSIAGFITDQFLFFLPALPVWIAGLFFLFRNPEARKWRVFGWMYVATLVILLAFSAKSYYTLGAYPVLIAAGAAWMERKTAESMRWIRFALPVFMLATGLPLLPLLLPVFPPEQEAAYMQRIRNTPGLEAGLRWEDGQYHSLPQDFADMLGWREVADLAGQAFQASPDRQNTLIYAENYGLAGAIEQFGKPYGIDHVLCFSDNYRYWLPDSLPAGFNTLIYVNDELGDDMPGFFEQIDKIGELNMPLSRQNGTQVYLCRQPKPAFFERINKVLWEVRHEQRVTR